MRKRWLGIQTICLISGLSGCSSSRDNMSTALLVELNGPVSHCSGFEWPGGEAAPAETYTHEKLCTLVLRLPSKTSVRTEARLVIIDQARGPLKETTGFESALDRLEGIVRELRMQDQKQVREALEEWKRKTPEFSVSTRGVVEERVGLFMEIKRHGDAGQWFIALTYNYYTDDRIDLWDNIKKHTGWTPGHTK